MTAASSPANGNRNYVAGEFIANSTTPDNGTNTGAGAQGALFAINPVAVLSAGATNWLEVSGGEVNIGMDPTASAKYMLGWTIIGGYNGLTGTAASMGAGVSVSSNTGATFDAGYIVSDLNAAWPIKASGSLQRAYITGSTPTVANGTDWSGVTFSGAAFKSQGFQVTGNGSVNAALSSFVANAGATGFPITTIQNAHNTAGDWALKIGAGATGSDSSTWLVLFEDGAMTGGVGTIARSTTGVVYNTASDRRLKENFREPSVGLDELMRIKAQNFNFINAPENDVNGFVAQDLYEIYPWAVTKGDDDDIKKPWQIDYGRLSPLIVNAMQQLIGKVDDLTARIAVLEKRLGEVT
jgi:hypothetical protein